MVVCIALGVDDVLRGGPCPPLYIRGDRVTWKVLAKYNWSPTTQSVSFYCTAASSTPIRVVTTEVKYIHELSLTVEHSIPVSSPAAPGLTLELQDEVAGTSLVTRKFSSSIFCWKELHKSQEGESKNTKSKP